MILAFEQKYSLCKSQILQADGEEKSAWVKFVYMPVEILIGGFYFLRKYQK